LAVKKKALPLPLLKTKGTLQGENGGRRRKEREKIVTSKMGTTKIEEEVL